jgi:hypothetical protein
LVDNFDGKENREKPDTSEDGGGGIFERQLEKLNDIVYDLIYETKNYLHNYLLSAELLKIYAEKLSKNPNLLSREEELKIIEQIHFLADFIIENVTEDMGTVNRARNRQTSNMNQPSPVKT